MSGKIMKFLLENFSIAATLALAIVAYVVAQESMMSDDYILLAISMGAIGGLVHEFFQSGGKILFFKKAEDGYYLGSIAGMVLGAVAGILFIRGELGSLQNPATDVDYQLLSINLFLAGLGLKGVAEAAAGKIVTKPDNGQ